MLALPLVLSGNVGGEAIIFVTTSSGKYSVIGFFHLGVLPEIRRVSIKMIFIRKASFITLSFLRPNPPSCLGVQRVFYPIACSLL
ncbi:hypothetical protein AHAS_Ahas19G0292100 [Arachis hypogaea]